MDISHGGGESAVAEAAPRADAPVTLVELATLSAASTVVLSTILAARRLVGLMIIRASEYSTFAPFGGWQLYGLAAAIGLLIVVLGVVAFAVGRKRFRELHGRTPYRRVAVLMALVPGLLLGIGAGLPLKPALFWASDHTSAARHEPAIESKLVAQYRAGPPLVSYHGLNADDPRLVRLLDPRELGPDWNARYDTSSVAILPPKPGETSSVRAVLHEQHWSNNSWHSDMIVVEEVETFDSAKDANRFSTGWLDTGSACGCTMAARVVDGVRVNVQTLHTPGYPVYHHAEFAHGRRVVLLYPFAGLAPSSKSARLPALLRAAVARAT